MYERSKRLFDFTAAALGLLRLEQQSRAAGNDHASSLMQCLNATHDYKRDRSRENFASAVNCQRALIPHGDPARFITDLDLLQSQVRSAEAARLARDDA